MKHLLQYLKGIANRGLEFGGPDLATIDLLMLTFIDASLANQMPSQHSTSSYVVFVARAPVIWKTKKQTFVAFSIIEVEFANLTLAALSTK